MKPASFVDAKLKRLETLCRSQGIPLTVQRRIILETMAGRTDHPTADQVYDTAKGAIRGISRTTVYRVLDTLVRLGMVVKVSNPEAIARFDADTSPHHHLICLGCGIISDCPDDAAIGLEMPIVTLKDFAVSQVALSITGFCAGCSSHSAP